MQKLSSKVARTVTVLTHPIFFQINFVLFWFLPVVFKDIDFSNFILSNFDTFRGD